MAYKGFSPSISSLDGVNVERIPSVQEQPVTSVIAEPAEGSVIDPDWQVATVRGYAYRCFRSRGPPQQTRQRILPAPALSPTWLGPDAAQSPLARAPPRLRSGGGKGIVRVDVSADGGKTWTSATLKEGSEQPLTRAWAWTFWEAEVPLPPGAEEAGEVEVVCKATDASYNVQPERIEGIWCVKQRVAPNSKRGGALPLPPIPPAAIPHGTLTQRCRACVCRCRRNLRGLNTNAWHRVKFAVKRAEE